VSGGSKATRLLRTYGGGKRGQTGPRGLTAIFHIYKRKEIPNRKKSSVQHLKKGKKGGGCFPALFKGREDGRVEKKEKGPRGKAKHLTSTQGTGGKPAKTYPGRVPKVETAKFWTVGKRPKSPRNLGKRPFQTVGK